MFSEVKFPLILVSIDSSLNQFWKSLELLFQTDCLNESSACLICGGDGTEVRESLYIMRLQGVSVAHPENCLLQVFVVVVVKVQHSVKKIEEINEDDFVGIAIYLPRSGALFNN